MRKAKRTENARRRGIKARRTFTLSPESLSLLEDLCAARSGSHRRSVSAVLDDLLQALVRQRKREAVERAIANYYDNLSESEQSEQREWGEFALSQFPDGSD